MIVKTFTLHSPSSSGGKIYRVEIHQVENTDRYMVYYANNSIHGPLKNKPKTPSSVPKTEAFKIAEAVVNGKLKGTYSLVENDAASSVATSNDSGNDAKFLTMPLHPIEDPGKYIKSDKYALSRKYDGERRIIMCNTDGVSGFGRYGQDKPIIVDVVSQLKSQRIKATFDSEAMSDRYMVFDLLSLNDIDLRSEPYMKRYEALKLLVDQVSIPQIQLVSSAFTHSEKKELLENYRQAGFEGVVFKHLDKAYNPAPSSNAKLGQFKYKFYKTASVICTERNKAKRSVSIELRNAEKPISVGNVTIPANATIPEPNQILEVKYLYASDGHQLVQPTFIRLRTDVLLSHCTLDQLIYRKL